MLYKCAEIEDMNAVNMAFSYSTYKIFFFEYYFALGTKNLHIDCPDIFLRINTFLIIKGHILMKNIINAATVIKHLFRMLLVQEYMKKKSFLEEIKHQIT